MGKFCEFIKTAGIYGGGSVILAIVCFAITVVEHIKDHNLPASVFGLLAIIFFYFGAFQAWNKERDARLEVENKYLNECPLLGLEISGPKGPKAWLDATNSDTCWFLLQQLSGRIATSIRFDPIPSKRGKYTLYFDAVPFLDPPPRSKALTYHIQGIGVHLTAHDLERIGNIEAKMLGVFLDDSPLELIKLSYVLIARFKDKGNEERIQSFNLTFDKTTFEFLPNTVQTA